MVPALVQEISSTARVLLLSRNEVPRQLARGLANREVSEISSTALAMTIEESEAVMTQPQFALDLETTRRLHNVTQGWAAGMILYGTLVRNRQIQLADLSQVVPNRVREYFGTEVLKTLSLSETRLLIRTAWLPYTTQQLASKVTGSAEAGPLISRLAQRGLFVTEHESADPHYQYHPLFKQFLRNLAEQELSDEQLTALRRRSADVLEQSGDAEHAIKLWVSIGEFERAAALVVAQAPKVLSQARFATLSRWLEGFPKDLMHQSPWLLYWKGMCTSSVKPSESLDSLHSAYTLFQKSGDFMGMALTCCGAMEAIYLDWKDFGRLDPWIERFEPIYEPWAKTVSPDLALRGAADMVGSLTWRNPDHPRLNEWTNLTTSLLQITKDPTAQGLAMSHLLCLLTWKGELDEAEQLANQTVGAEGESTLSPIWILGRTCFKGIVCWNRGDYETAEKYISTAVTYARETGVHVADHHLYAQGIYNSLLSGDRARAHDYQKRFSAIRNPAHPFIEAHFHHLISWAAWLNGNLEEAWRCSQIALRGAQRAGTPFPIALNLYMKAILLYHRGFANQALASIRHVLRIGQRMNSSLLQFMGLLAKAYFTLDKAEASSAPSRHQHSTSKRLREEAFTDLARGLALGREYNLGAHSLWMPQMMSRLCAMALEAGIEVPYVQQLIRRTRLSAPDRALHISAWPWPVRIFTLGRFGVQWDGKPLRFSGKAQKKPLELLKVLIAFGGRKVSDTLVADTLWPEADGDAGYRAIITTVQRLRKMLGASEAIQHTEGTLTLNPQLCWVDAWAFERMLGQAKKDATADERALQLYQGTFLGNETEAPWADRMRQRLRNDFLRAADVACQQKAKQRCWKDARECYERALAVEPHSEELFQGLILCLSKLDQRVEALTAYRRCRTMLASQFGVTPSQKTEGLYESIRDM